MEHPQFTRLLVQKFNFNGGFSVLITNQLILFVISMQYSGDCAHVLENDDSMVTSCAFSGDSSLLATGITRRLR